ncbi:MAG: nucleotidyltransferase family protein [Gemmatimonadales bacterium]|jgi:predicted nucleotidyltransferase
MVAIDHERLTELCRQHGVAVLKIFGSAARGDDSPDSDIDLLIEFRGRKGLFELVSLEIELTEMFGRKVDLVTEASLSPYIRDRILSSASVIYEGDG